MTALPIIKPNWPAPANVHAFTTTRKGGFSLAPFNEFNLALHVEDDPQTVLQNRQYLMTKCTLPNTPYWLNQTHSTIVVETGLEIDTPTADASYTQQKNSICTVLTADCLPILICDKAGSIVSAIHAGWKGLGAGIIAATLMHLPVPNKDLLVWLGPAIGPQAFAVQQDVVDYFLSFDPDSKIGFTRISDTHYLGNKYQLAKQQLEKAGIVDIYGGEYCTYTQNDLFFSYRRDKKTGRMASLIWLE